MEPEDRRLAREDPAAEPGPAPADPAYDHGIHQADPAYPARYPGEPGVVAGSDTEVVSSRFWAARRATELVYLIFAVICTLFVFRILMKALGANPAVAFTGFVYGLTDVFLAPFRGLLPTMGTGRNLLELSAVFALLVYALLGYLLAWLVAILFMRDESVTRTRRRRFRPY